MTKFNASPSQYDSNILDLRPVTEACRVVGTRIDRKTYSSYPAWKALWKAVMPSLTITAKGHVILKRDLLQHLGVRPGERIDIDKLPNGELRIRAAQPTGSIDGFLGLLAGKTAMVATIEEMNQAAAAGWVGDK